MSYDNTLNRFTLISGLDICEAQKWADIVNESRDYIDRLVTSDELFEDDIKRLDNAAAVYAYYRYVSCNVSGESSFSAGDLKLSFNNDKLNAAREMWENELKSLSDIVDTEKSVFYFKRVSS